MRKKIFKRYLLIRRPIQDPRSWLLRKFICIKYLNPRHLLLKRSHNSGADVGILVVNDSINLTYGLYRFLWFCVPAAEKKFISGSEHE